MIKSPGLWLAVLSASTVFYLVGADLGRTSPGPLATVHERVPELAGARGCNECHGGWLESMGEACLACHAAVAEHVESGAGLHGKLPPEQVQNCALCHSDHHGPDFDIVNAVSFATAGVPDAGSFDHALLGFPMAGRHVQLDCTECHTNARVEVLAEGTHRFLGLDARCTACHEDSHDGEYTLGCLSCHSQESFSELHSAGHEAHLPLTGRHADRSCAECHPDSGAHSLAFLGTGRRRARERACLDCHESPHAERFVQGIARLEGTSLEASCATCHDPDLHADFGDDELTLTRKQHASSGFRLVDPHRELACADCHADDGGDFAVRFPGRSADDCGACHVDPHEGQFEGGAFGADGCLACHERERFDPHHFDVRDHELTAMPLRGSHTELECHACHSEPHGDSPRLFRGLGADCAICHTDAHLGFFDARTAPRSDVASEVSSEAPARALPLDAVHASGRDCSTCHEPTTFQELTAPFDHALWTGFAVTGAHAQTGCETCHARSAQPDHHGRTFGRIDDHFGEYVGCVTCHADPHRGRFDAEHLPETVGDRAGCARCHDATSFRNFPNGFFHTKWTGFRLIGEHREIECSACHSALPSADEFGRTWAEAAGNQCYDCHADPHAGQFRRKGLTDCSRCHASAKGWDDLAFDHNEHSRFPLEEQHRDLDCAACHEAWPLADGTEVLRYRPLGRLCVDCHGVHEQQMRERAEDIR